MSNTRLNIRFLMWHFQILDNWKFQIKHNEYHRGLNHGWFAIYDFDLFK